MTDSNNSISANGGIDKDFLYGKFQNGEDRRAKRIDWRDNVHRRAVHKELDLADEDEMGDLNIDKSTRVREQHIHHHAAPAPPAAKKLGALAKLAIGAGLIGTGAGVMAGAPLIISALKDWKQPAAVQPNDTDTDTTGELMLWPPKAK